MGEIVGHERRAFDVAVLTLRPQYLLPFTPGQSIGVSHPAVRSWRYYSPANAPRADGTIELHVRAAPGGAVAPAWSTASASATSSTSPRRSGNG